MLDLKGYEASILKGAMVTIEVALLSLVLAVVLGMLGALAKMAPYKWARAIATIYTTVIRGIRDLVLMMLIFFGGQILLNNTLYSINETLNEWFASSDPNHEWTSYLPASLSRKLLRVLPAPHPHLGRLRVQYLSNADTKLIGLNKNRNKRA